MREFKEMNTTKSDVLTEAPAQPHLEEIGEGYFEHMGFAFSFSRRMIVAGFFCFLHGLFPNTFRKTGSNCIAILHDEMVVNRANLKYLNK